MINTPSSDLLIRERDILARIAVGGPLDDILRDIVLTLEHAAGGGLLASILIVSEDGKRLIGGAAPSLPEAYNAAVDGIPVGHGVGSCGTAAFSGEPVVVSDIATDPLWKDFRDLALSHNLRACWSMPLQSSDGAILGTFANYYREPREPTDRDMEMIAMVARTTSIAIERHRHEAARKRAEEQRLLLIRELNHRVKNVFSLASALIAFGARTATSPQELAASVQQRLVALSRAHEHVQPGFGDEEAAVLPGFRSILDDILAPYRIDGQSDRVAIAGLDFPLRPDAITSIALVLHELATNAVKYGCLKDADGTLSINWTVEQDFLTLRWTEIATATVKPPERSGFGSTLLMAAIERQLGGTIAYAWRPEGVTITIRFPFQTVSC